MIQSKMVRYIMLNRLLKLVISLAYCPFHLMGRALSKGVGARPSGVILLYHQVQEEEKDRFEWQMDALSRLATPVTLENLISSEGTGHRVAVTFDDGIQNVVDNALPVLRDKGIPATIFFPPGYFGLFPDWIAGQDPENESGWVMTAETARDLPTDLIDVGSHTLNHKPLTRLEHGEVDTELIESKRILEETFGRSIDSIAFPYGFYNARIAEQARMAGYRRAYSADPEGVGGYVSGRVDLGPSDWPLEFRLKVLGAYRWVPVAIILKGLFLKPFRRNRT